MGFESWAGNNQAEESQNVAEREPTKVGERITVAAGEKTYFYHLTTISGGEFPKIRNWRLKRYALKRGD